MAMSAARVRGTSERVLEAFPLLTRLLKRTGEGLSGGERQTLAIARALMPIRELLLLDEVSLGPGADRRAPGVRGEFRSSRPRARRC